RPGTTDGRAAYCSRRILASRSRHSRTPARIDRSRRTTKLDRSGGTSRPFEEDTMTVRVAAALAIAATFALAGSAVAQDLGPQVKKLADGVYTVVGNNHFSNSGIILTEEGVVVVDAGQNPVEGRKILEIIKKLTPMPVRM